MLIMPKRGYRVCLHCGKIMLAKQVVSVNKQGKQVKACPYCNEEANKSTGHDKLAESVAMDLFKIVEMKSKEFNITEELELKYNKMYDNCLVPYDVRI